MPPPETYKSEIGSQPTICQARTGAYVSLLAPEKHRLHRLPPRKDYQVLLCIYYTWYLSLRQRPSDSSQLEQTKERREKTENKRKESGKGKEKLKIEKTRRGSKERKVLTPDTLLQSFVTLPYGARGTAAVPFVFLCDGR